MNDYKVTIGIEVHVELHTKTKIFSPSLNQVNTFANSNVNVIDLGYPGTLPLINKEVINQAIKAAHVLNCDLTKVMHFDRKNYFYPDNAKNYQITQARTPIGRNGYIEIENKKIYLEEIHIEEDTAKSMHQETTSLLDFNRSGVPLIEIVSKPCITSGDEAVAYLEKLKETLFYAGISDCKIEEGSMRCDANVSISKTDVLGTKIEIKNIGSISNVKLAIDSEIKRQQELLEQGVILREETRRLDEKNATTILMRVKEVGNDYRYFPEPDIPFVHLTEEQINNAIETIPMMPKERRNIYLEKGLNPINIEKVIANINVSNYLNNYLDSNIDLVIASNLLLGDIASYLNKTNLSIEETSLTRDKFINLVNKISSKELTSKNVKDILEDLLSTEKSLEGIIKEKNITNISDSNLLLEIVTKVINDNPQSIVDYKEGKERATKYLMGQIMKETKGSANPSLVNQLLLEELNKQ